MIGEVCAAVDTAVGAMTFTRQVSLECLHHGGGERGHQSSDGKT